jgi:hypothetical protein
MTPGPITAWAVVCSLVVSPAAAASQASSLPPAQPIDAITAVVDAFRSHPLAALFDAHGNREAHTFLLSLIRDPRFAATVNDIVMSVGNARYQDVMDRFVRGEAVPYESLRLAWRNTTAENLSGDLPTHEEIFRAVRAVNASLPRERQIRVLLADPPIDWDSVRSPADYDKWREMRASYAAALVQVEVLARERRALLVHHGLDLQRKSLVTNYDMEDRRSHTIVSLIEHATPARVFTIWEIPEARLAPLRADAVTWRAPSLAIIRGTAQGAADFTAYHPRGEGPRFRIRDGRVVQIPREEWRPLRAEEQFDAVLYLGPPSTAIGLSQAICSEPGYVEMRLKRLAVAGLPPPLAAELKQHCAAAPGRQRWNGSAEAGRTRRRVERCSRSPAEQPARD